MKLLVRKLWFPHSVDETVEALFQIGQMQLMFDEGYVYLGEMRPQGIKICPRYWPAGEIMKRVPNPGKDVCLVLTSMDLKGDYRSIHGKGDNRVSIASNDSFRISNRGFNFDSKDPSFNAMVFGEVGHALGLAHHALDLSNPCEMSHSDRLGYHWSSLDEIRFCNDCYKKIE